MMRSHGSACRPRQLGRASGDSTVDGNLLGLMKIEGALVPCEGRKRELQWSAAVFHPQLKAAVVETKRRTSGSAMASRADTDSASPPAASHSSAHAWSNGAAVSGQLRATRPREGVRQDLHGTRSSRGAGLSGTGSAEDEVHGSRATGRPARQMMTTSPRFSTAAKSSERRTLASSLFTLSTNYA